MTAAESTALLERAALLDQQAIDSFERSDTDGFTTQQASTNMAQLARAQATIAANDGYAQFPALFDLDGNPLPAKLIHSRYGTTWLMLDADAENGHAEGTGQFVNPSRAAKDDVRRRNDAKKGIYVGHVKAKAYATHSTGNHEAYGFTGLHLVHVVTLREDRGFSRDVVIVDNGH